MRVVGGKFRGASLRGPGRQGEAIRPTSDRLRESIFNILEHWPDGSPLQHARVLDLFAGTGALGIEALSRGADFALFVEHAADARALIRSNIETLHLAGVCRLFRRDATRLGEAGNLGAFTLVFADPPYGKRLGEAALAAALAGGWVAPGAVIVVEEARRAGFAAPEGFEIVQRRVYGDSEVIFLQPSAPAE